MNLCEKKDCILRGKIRVPFFGDTKNVSIMFVGESPGEDEEIADSPFIGRSGKLLYKLAAKAGLFRYNAFIANGAMCRIIKDELKTKEINSILNMCRSHLEEEIHIHKPKVIVALGALAAQQLIKIKSLGDTRGTFVWSDEFNCYVLPTYHPSFCLRRPSAVAILTADFFRVRTFLTSKGDILSNEEIVIEERESISDVIADARSIAVDTETQGLDYINPTNIMISYSISDASNRAYQVLLHEECKESEADFTIPWERGKGKKNKHWENIFVKKCSNFKGKVEELGQLLGSPTIKKIFMNGNYDIHHIVSLFKNNGFPRPEINNYTLDTQTLSQLIEENLYARSSLELLRKSFTTLSTQYSDKFGEEFNKGDMLSVPKEELAKYAAADACVTFNVAQGLVAALKKEKEQEKLLFYYTHMVMPVSSKFLLHIEEVGVSTDMASLPKVREDLQKEADYLYMKIIATIPHKIKAKYKDKRTPEAPLTKINMIKEMIYSKDGYGVPKIKDPKTGKELDSLDKKIRQELISRKISKKALEFIDDYNRWKMIDTLLSKYINGIENATRIDGKIHPSFSLAVAATGRSSCLAEYTHIRVKTDTSNYLLKNIQDIREGDVVYSYDEETHSIKLASVKWAGKTGDMSETIVVEYTVEGGYSPSGSLRCTPEHLIFTLNRGFISARELHPRDELLGVLPERATVSRVILDYKKIDVYDLTIDGPSNFIANGICVHNSANPNLQNIPKRGPLAKTIRRLFISSPGHVFLAVDASQSELRWLAFLAQDPVMLKIYRTGGDIHAATAEAIRGKARDKMTPEEFKDARQASKAVNFSLIYGGGARLLQRTAKQDYGVIFSDKEAQDFREIFFKKYPAIRPYHRSIIEECREKGYVMSPLGRVRRLPEVHSFNSTVANRAERQALNHAIQSVSSDAVLLSGTAILDKLNLDECFPCLFIHDELIFECLKDKVAEYAPLIKYHMENPPLEQFGVRLNLPLVADMKMGRSLADMEDYNAS